ncbi:MAG TPA: hypothetical protein PKB03_02565 [Baekduia sp.]|nr:hypothetical protein [Baekduia sp.]
MTSTVIRVTMAAIAIAACVWFVADGRAATQCRDAREAVFAASLRGPVEDAAVSRVIDRCGDAEQVAIIAMGLRKTQPQAAERLAAAAQRAEPDLFSSNAALALTASDLQTRRGAWAAAKSANPRWSAPEPR